MPKFSVKRPFTVFVAVVIFLILGVVSFTRMTTDLLPDFSLPYMMVVTTYPGASPEKVESQVTDPLEDALGTINGVKNVISQSGENYSMVMLEFEEGTNMDSSMVKMSGQIDLLTLPDEAGQPMIMELSMDMIDTMEISVDYEGMDIYELSEFVNENVIPEIERVDGVASVSSTGLVEKYVEVRLDSQKVDQLNDRLAAYVSDELADAKAEIDDAKAELSDAKAELDEQEENLASQQSSTSNELAQGSQALDQALATQAAFEAQLVSLEADQTALETEKKAYEDAGIQESYDQVNELFASMQAAASSFGVDPQTLPEDVSDVLSNPSKLDNLKAMMQKISQMSQMGSASAGSGVDLSQIQGASGTADTDLSQIQGASGTADTDLSQIQGATESTDTDLSQIQGSAGSTDLSQMEAAAEAVNALTIDSLQQMDDILHVRIPQIDTALANLEIEKKSAQAVVDSVNEQMSQVGDQYNELEIGKIQAAAGFGSADAQLAAGKTAIEDGEAQLDEALESYNKARDEALKQANLDQLVSMDTLSQMLYAQNFDMPAGYIYTSDEKDQYLLKVGEEFADETDLADTLLCNIDGLGDVRLSDVASITWMDNSMDAYAKINGNQAVVLGIGKGSTAGTSEVSDACNEKIEELQNEYDGLHIVNLMDQGEYIDIIINSVLSNLIIGAILAVIVLLIFLRRLSPTLVVAFSIPMSVMVAIVLMYFSGVTLNIISLSGLALGVGMLVDNSIVVIENIYRLRGKGVSAARAAVMGAKQVSGAIVSSTLTTICVFLPIVFTSGLTRELFTDMALTITYSLVASLLVALTVVPSMSATLLKKTLPKKERFLDKMRGVYEKVLRFCLKVKLVPIAIAVALLVISAAAAFRMGLVLFPEMGSTQMSAEIDINEELSDEEAYQMADEIMTHFREMEGVETVGAISGGGSGDASVSLLVSGSTNHQFTYYILLDEDAANDNKFYADEMSEYLDTLDCEYTVSESNMDMSELLESGMEVDIYGKDTDVLLDISGDIMEMLESIDGFEEISNGQEEGDPEITVVVDKDKAMRLGLTVAQIYQELSGELTTEKDATNITVDGDQYTVVVVEENEDLTPDNILDYTFTTTAKDEDGNDVEETHELGEFATLQDGQSLVSIQHENLTTYVAVTASAADGYNTTLLSRKFDKLMEDYEVPDGYTVEVAGETSSIMDMLDDLFLMIGLGIVLVYLIMVAQFQSLLSPFIVIFTIPLAFTGGLLALMITRQEISMVSMMGFLMLAGVVVNNGIVFVDYANQLRLGGMKKKEALIETGRSRMRPILMTALTTILAMSVMAVSQDVSADMSRGMAIVTIGGLLYATFMTLFIVPVLYDLLFRRELKKVDLGDEDTLDEEI